MGRTIVYQRRFISVGDKFIPLFQYGSSNCTEFYRGREVSEKNWGVLNWGQPLKILFSKEEIADLSKIYVDADYYKSYHVAFKVGEFVRWFTNGTKHAQTVEYYLEHSNRLTFVKQTEDGYEEHNISSSEELLNLINVVNEKNLKRKEPLSMNLRFCLRDLTLPKKVRQPRQKKEHPYYYILTSAEGYFIKQTRDGYKYSPFKDGDSKAKKFASHTEADKYLNKYPYLKHHLAPQFVYETAIF